MKDKFPLHQPARQKAQAAENKKLRRMVESISTLEVDTLMDPVSDAAFEEWQHMIANKDIKAR
jgi:hypothetical protein